MKHFKKLNILVLSLALLIPVFFISCASDQEVITKDIAEKKLYDQAQRRLKTNNFVSAILTLETLEKRFPFGKYAEQAQIELVYAYYKSVNYDQAILAAERFISLHPRHPNVDYAYYIKMLLDLADTTMSLEYKQKAQKLCIIAIDKFYDKKVSCQSDILC